MDILYAYKIAGRMDLYVNEGFSHVTVGEAGSNQVRPSKPDMQHIAIIFNRYHLNLSLIRHCCIRHHHHQYASGSPLMKPVSAYFITPFSVRKCQSRNRHFVGCCFLLLLG